MRNTVGAQHTEGRLDGHVGERCVVAPNLLLLTIHVAPNRCVLTPRRCDAARDRRQPHTAARLSGMQKARPAR